MNDTRPRTALSVVLAILLSGFAAQATAESQIRWETPTKGFVATKGLTSYRAVPVERIGQEQAQKMLEQLREATGTKAKFDGLREIDGRFVFTTNDDPSAVFDLDSRTGGFLFNAGLKGYSEEASTRDLPATKEAPDVARKYLAKLHYLPENDKELVVSRVGGLAMAAAKDGESSDSYQKLVTVYFGRVLGDLRVQGRGSRMLVHLGESSALVGVIRVWTEVEARIVDSDQVKSDERILDEIRRRLYGMAGQAEEIVVEKAELVLFDDGRGVIEPAIYVVTTARYEGPERAKDGVEIPVDFYVPVLLKSEGYYPFQQDAEAKWPGSDAEN